MPKNNREDQLDEKNKFSADHSPSEIPGPVDKNAKSPEDDNDPHKETSNITDTDSKASKKMKHKTKAEMTSEVLELMKNKKKVELESLMPDILKALSEQKDDDDDEEDMDDDDTESKNDDDDMEEEGYGKKKKGMKEAYKITKNDLDLEEDVQALFGKDDLTEEFKSEATTVFEAAVVSKVNNKLNEMAKDFRADLENTREELVNEMSDKLDEYMDYVVEEWTKENELAIDTGIRNQIAESFIKGLKNVFEDHYIDVPDDKVDVVEELGNRVEELENSLNEQIEKNLDLKEEVSDLKKNDVLDEVCEGLVDTEAEKMRSLAEGVDFDSEDDYRSKLNTIKEKYFGEYDNKSKSSKALTEEIDDNPVNLDEDEEKQDNVPAHMKNYMSAISRTVR